MQEYINIIISVLLYLLRVIQPFLAIFVIYKCFSSMRKKQRPEQPLIALIDTLSEEVIPVMYWENSIGRGKTSDILLENETVSRNHAVLYRRDEGWLLYDTNSKAGTKVNNEQIVEPTAVFIGDTIEIGNVQLKLDRAKKENILKKSWFFDKDVKNTMSPWMLMLLTSVCHFFLLIDLSFSGDYFNPEYILPFCLLSSVGWLFFFISTVVLRRVNFELEIIAFFLSGIGILLIASDSIKDTFTQITAMLLGMVLFTALIKFLEEPDRSTKYRLIVSLGSIGLLVLNLILGTTLNGSKNWILIGPVSIQPSEFIKVALILVGTSTLAVLQTTKNLTEFIGFSGICIGALFLMSDFGTACIFFMAFLIIAFIRSGDIRTIIFILSGAIFGVFLILKFKPYIAERFSSWGHAFDYIDSTGYQSAHVLTYSASGGLFGLGLGQGNLKYIFASTSDLVFGMLCEELGIIFALTVVLTIVALAFYARAISATSRSTLYSIAACSVGGMYVFQTALNVFGATDILPLTGVTLPFISLGGSSMISTWGLLAFIKAADERTYALKRGF